MPENTESKEIENETLKTQMLEQLETVIDPELGIDIVNLGLVYDLRLYENGLCEVHVTLTTMGCPFGDVIEEDIRNALSQFDEMKEINVKFIWYPAWNPSRMTRYAKIALGMN